MRIEAHSKLKVKTHKNNLLFVTISKTQSVHKVIPRILECSLTSLVILSDSWGGCYGSLWLAVGRCDSFLVVVGRCGSLWLAVGRCGSLCLAVGRCGSLWIVMACSGSLWLVA